MKKRKKSGKRTSPKFLKSRKFLFFAAVLLALVVIAGFTMFAGSKSVGRVFSWKEGKVKNNWGSVKKAPGSEYQFVMYSASDWGGEYYGIYTENTNPLYASRDLTPGITGEDVRALKGAVKHIGAFPVWRGSITDTQSVTATDTVNTLNPGAFSGINVGDPVFDTNTVNAIKAISYPSLDSSYGTYLDDNKLDTYEQSRILVIAASNWGTTTDSGKMTLLKVGSSKASVSVDVPNSASWATKTTTYWGQDSLRKSGESQRAAYPKFNFAVKKIVDKSDKTVAGKSFILDTIDGGYARLVQSALNLAIEWGHAGVIPKNKTNAKYDAKTKATINGFEKFYGLTEDGKWDSRLEYHVLMELGYSLQG